MKKIIFALMVSAMFAFPANAGTYDVLVKNSTHLAAISVFVFGGEVEGFERIPYGHQGSFKVILPNGVCQASMRIRFRNNKYYDVANHNFCDQSRNGFVISGGARN